METQIVLGQQRLTPEKFTPIRNQFFIKPIGGLWSSTYNKKGRYVSSWHMFCMEGFRKGLENNSAVIFNVKEDVRIYTVDSYEDLLNLQNSHGGIRFDDFSFFNSLNFEEIKMNYDIIHLTDKGEYETRYSSPSLYGWDCECSLMLNYCVGNQHSIQINSE